MTRKKTKTGTGLGSSKSKVNITLAPEANEILVALAKETGLTKSKLFEQILVGGFIINSQNADTKVVLGDDDSEQKFSIAEVNENSEESENKSASVPVKNDVFEEDIKNQQEKIAELENQLNQQKDLIADKSQSNRDLESQLQAKQNELNSIQKELESKNNRIKSLEDNLDNVKKDLDKSDQSEQLKKVNKELNLANNTIDNLNEKISKLESLAQEKNIYINELKEQNSALKNKANNKELKSVIEEQKKKIEYYCQQVAKKEQEKIALSQNHATQQNTISKSLTKENAEQRELIASLNKRLVELQSVANIGERMLNKWRRK